MAYNENVAPTFAAAEPASEPAFRRWHDAIAEMADRVASLGEEVGLLANDIFGPVPQAVVKHSDRPEPNSQAAALEAQIDRLRQNFGGLLDQFQRVKQLV